jgi:dolichol kinase
MEKMLSNVFLPEVTYKAPTKELKTELIRKGIHLLIAFVPPLASISVTLSLVLLGGGVIFYAWAEKLRCEGKRVYIISRLTALASRKRDEGHFIMGPITLGLGAMAALFFYPEPSASIAIYALAFGDSLSSIAGKALGGYRIPFTGGKTVTGSVTCFVAVFSITLLITSNPAPAIAIASFATLLELIPLKDLDNIVIPMGTGLVASLFFTVV